MSALRHEPITPEQRIENLARHVASQPSRGQRGERAQNIKRLHGQAFAQRVVDRARELLRTGYTPRRIETPAARTTDPDTSHQAAAEVTTNGSRHGNQRIVAATVAAHPGCTSRELTRYCTLQRHEIARRLPECETAERVKRGDARPCELGGRAATTWWPA